MNYSPDQINFKIMKFWFGCILSIMLLTGCFLNPSPETPTPILPSSKTLIQVSVRDSKEQLPLKNARVRLLIPGQTFGVEFTDEYGMATFLVNENLMSQVAEFEVILTDYQILRHKVTLENALMVPISLSPAGEVTTVTVQAEPTETSPPPTPTLEDVVFPTPTNTITPTNTPSPTSTLTPTNSPTPSPIPESSAREPETIATAIMNSSIFEEQSADSTELAYIFPGDYVVVLEEQEFWLLVRNYEGVEGWVAANRFDVTLGTPTPVPIITAVTIESASIFEAPDSDSMDITYIDPGVEVRVLGRSSNSAWLFVRTDGEVEGWVATNRMTLSVDVEMLSVVNVIVQSTPSSSGGTQQGSFSLDFWSLPGESSCSGGGWIVTLFLEAHDGDAPYTYYVNDELVAGAVVGNVTKQVSGAGSTSRIYVARVISSSGQVVTKEILVAPPECN